VFFRELNDCIRIVAVAHGARKPGIGRVASEHIPNQVLESAMNREKLTDLDAALATMSADGLRGLVHELLRELDERRGAAAFLRKDYSAAHRTFGTSPVDQRRGDRSESRA
jgi:hypothetical protein